MIDTNYTPPSPTPEEAEWCEGEHADVQPNADGQCPQDVIEQVVIHRESGLEELPSTGGVEPTALIVIAVFALVVGVSLFFARRWADGNDDA